MDASVIAAFALLLGHGLVHLFDTALLLFLLPRGSWSIGGCAVIVSISPIVPSWHDAMFGALANTIVAVSVVIGFLAQGPWRLSGERDWPTSA